MLRTRLTIPTPAGDSMVLIDSYMLEEFRASASALVTRSVFLTVVTLPLNLTAMLGAVFCKAFHLYTIIL